MHIQSTRDYGTDALKFVIYGPAGVGKTTLASTCGGRVCIVSAEGGLLSLHGHDIDFIDITRDDDGKLVPKQERFDKLSEIYKYLQGDEAKKKYDWVFIDSLTEIGQNLYEKLKLKFPEKKDSMNLWGEYADGVRAMIKAFRDLPRYHVVFTALSHIEKDELGRRHAGVDLQGKIAHQLPGFMDFVLYFHAFDDDAGVKQRVLITQPSDKITAKDRSGKLAEVEVPNLLMIANKIKGEANA